VRRGFWDEWASHKSAIAKEALNRIGALFDIERPIAGAPPDIRRAVRQRAARPRIDELATWLDEQLNKLPGKSDLAGAIQYARSRWHALTRYLDDGRLEISNNAAENQIRPAALGRKNWLFCGSDAGGERAAAFYTLVRNRPAQRPRARGMAHRRHRAHRCPSDQPARRIPALELVATGDAKRRRLSQPSSREMSGSLRLSLTIKLLG
jgi:hypothetical protein